jgi:thiamine pyrophosphate-dependent acetolactate synthase large subunit-like protein
MQGRDTLLMVGTGFPWSEFLPKDGAARAVQIDIEASMLSLRYPAEVNLHGDAAATLKALLPLIRRNDDREWSKTIEANVAAWWKKLEGRLSRNGAAKARENGRQQLGPDDRQYLRAWIRDAPSLINSSPYRAQARSQAR